MDEGSDQTGDSDDYDDDDDGYDDASADDGDCESTFYYGPRGQTSSGRLCRRNVATRGGGSGGGGSGDNSTFRIRSKWKKYHYQAVPRAMTIQEEDEEMAGPSSSTTTTAAAMTTATAVTPTSGSATRGATTFSLEYLPHNLMANPNSQNPNRTIQIPNIHVTMANERNRHVIIHVNDVELSQDDETDDCGGGSGGGGVGGGEDDSDDNDDDEEIYDFRTQKSISENDSLLVAYDSNSVSSV